jgi:hypothetical protein
MTHSNSHREPLAATRARRTSLVHLVGLLGAAALLPSWAAACSDSGDDGSSAASSTGTLAGSGGAGTGGDSSSGNQGGDVFSGNGGTGGDVGSGGACAAEEFVPDLIPLDIYLVFDQSGSMNQAADGTSTRWEAVTNAVKAFVQSAPADTSVGVQYFPLFQSAVTSCTTDADCPGICFMSEGAGHCFPEPPYECSAAAYAVPDVGIAPLPGNESALVASLDAHYPFGGTPTAPALEGGIAYASAWAEANPTHKTVVVLATDGYPTDCAPTDIPSIAAIASAGAAATPAISTFVIGVGDGLDNLNAIAVAGGSEAAFVVTDANAGADFAAALEAIRKSLACEFIIPTPTSGEPDYDKVNVQYTPGGGMAAIVGKVADLAACTDEGGWYYDDPQNPQVIHLCPDTCSVAKADPNGKVDVLLGCKTIIADPA